MKETALPETLNCPYCLAEMQLKTRIKVHIFKITHLDTTTLPPLKPNKHYYYHCEPCNFDFTSDKSDTISVQNFHAANPDFKKWKKANP